jgi:NADH-quinone oxidoreductase subunit I
MAINVKVLGRPIEETSYVRATLKGLGNTFKHMVDPHKVTTQYPEQRESISPRWR